MFSFYFGFSPSCFIYDNAVFLPEIMVKLLTYLVRFLVLVGNSALKDNFLSADNLLAILTTFQRQKHFYHSAIISSILDLKKKKI